ERVDRSGRPASARLAVAVAHSGRLAADGELHRAAEAASFVRAVVAHDVLPVVWQRTRTIRRCLPRSDDRGSARGGSATAFVARFRNRTRAASATTPAVRRRRAGAPA